MARRSKIVEAAFSEVKHNEPKNVGHTRKKFGAARAEAQETAIALNKARQAGARLPRRRGAVRRMMA